MISIIILAAGQGTRMRSAIPKVMHELAGKPVIEHVVHTANKLKPKQICIVYSKETEQLKQRYTQKNIIWALQKEQKGTGHAVATALKHIKRPARVLVICADTPAITATTLRKIANKKNTALLTTTTDNPKGYGRIIRGPNNKIQNIVEEADATAQQRKITEVNTGILAADADDLAKWLKKTTTKNKQKEYYLPDAIQKCVQEGKKVEASQADHQECQGINTRRQLHDLERYLQQQQAEKLSNNGTTIKDINRIDIRGEVTTGMDCTIDINVILEGTVKLGGNVTIGANSIIRNSVIGSNTTIHPNTIMENTTTGKNCQIGPFARIRPTTTLKDNTKIGNFVELKQATIQEGTKINHLSYIGDAEIGKQTNIGAGTITCNYDGKNKHKTKIGNQANIGANANLIAPIKIADNTIIAAGSTITTDVPANTLAVERTKQRNIRKAPK